MAKNEPVAVERSRRPVTICTEPPVRQSPGDIVDINQLMARYEKTGLVPYDNAEALYADVSSFGDYRDVIERARRAESLFMDLPVKVRNRFDNDPAKFIDFVRPENEGELREMGLMAAKPPEEAAPSKEPQRAAGAA